MNYTAYGKECRLTFSLIFSGQWGLRSEYRVSSGSSWVYIAEPTIYETDIDTKAKTDAVYQSALNTINAATNSAIGTPAPDDDSGAGEIQRLINGTTVVNNNLVM